MDPVEKSLLWDSDSAKINFLANFMQALPEKGVDDFFNSKGFSLWVKYLLKMMKRAKSAPECTALISVMGWMWQKRLEDFEGHESGLPNAFLAFLKNCSLHQSEIVFTRTIIMMFSLME